MTPGRGRAPCASLSEVCGGLAKVGCDWLLVHESALMGWGIDNNVFLPAVDVLLGAGGFAGLGTAPHHGPGEFSEAVVAGRRARFWTRESLGLPEAFESTDCPEYGARALAPEYVLDRLALSPDARYLVEQRAILAEILFADRLNDDAIGLFDSYVRTP